MSGDGNKPVDITQRDATVAAAVIQWLGSHVGRGFLCDVLGVRIRHYGDIETEV